MQNFFLQTRVFVAHSFTFGILCESLRFEKILVGRCSHACFLGCLFVMTQLPWESVPGLNGEKGYFNYQKGFRKTTDLHKTRWSCKRQTQEETNFRKKRKPYQKRKRTPKNPWKSPWKNPRKILTSKEEQLPPDPRPPTSPLVGGPSAERGAGEQLLGVATESGYLLRHSVGFRFGGRCFGVFLGFFWVFLSFFWGGVRLTVSLLGVLGVFFLFFGGGGMVSLLLLWVLEFLVSVSWLWLVSVFGFGFSLLLSVLVVCSSGGGWWKVVFLVPFRFSFVSVFWREESWFWCHKLQNHQAGMLLVHGVFLPYS